MEKNFIEFNGTLINTRYIKRIFKLKIFIVKQIVMINTMKLELV